MVFWFAHAASSEAAGSAFLGLIIVVVVRSVLITDGDVRHGVFLSGLQWVRRLHGRVVLSNITGSQTGEEGEIQRTSCSETRKALSRF